MPSFDDYPMLEQYLLSKGWDFGAVRLVAYRNQGHHQFHYICRVWQRKIEFSLHGFDDKDVVICENEDDAIAHARSIDFTD